MELEIRELEISIVLTADETNMANATHIVYHIRNAIDSSKVKINNFYGL